MRVFGQRSTARKGAKRKRLGGRGARAGLFGVVLLALALLGTSIASAAAAYINLTTASATVNFNAAGNGGVGTALYVQGGSGAGTGQFDPFLTVSSNSGTEKGYNTTAASGEFDTFFGGGRTHPLQAAAIPPVTISGVVYREFSLDANDQGGDDWMSIDAIKVFLDDQNDLTGFNAGTNSFSSDVAPTATRIYDQGNGIVLMRSQTLTPGSGVSDITVFVPDALFPANCFYGSLTCGEWVYFYTQMGLLDSTADPLSNGVNWNVTAGFEEWRTRLLPVVNVSKTVNLSRTRTFNWDLTKQVSIDGGATWQDADTVNLFNGQSQNYLWRVVATKDAGTITNPQISGNIVVTNPTGGTVISSSIDAVINSVSDVLPVGNSPAATVSCPVTFPFTLKAQQTLTCTYSSNLTSTADGTNTASAVVENGDNDLTYSGTAPVVWANATTTNVDNSANISDPNSTDLNQTGITASGTFTSGTKTFTCGSTTTITNTATLTEVTSGQTHSDSASLTVNCYGLTVDKTVATALTRDFDWTVTKQVSIDGGATWHDSASVDLFNGQSQNYLWKIVWTKDAGHDSGWLISGTITISNPAPMAATGVSVTDLLSISGAAAVDCDPGAGVSTTVNIAANSSATCTYSKTLGAATDQTNTATASLFGHSYNSPVKTVSFAGATLTLIDNTATIDDPNFPGFDGGVSASGNSTSTTRTYTCGSDTTITNTVNLTEDDSDTLRTDSASLTVDCHGLTVTKTAATTLTRTWHWKISKSSTDGIDPNCLTDACLTLQPNETFDYHYSIVVDLDGAPTDSNWAVSGTITVTNNAPIDATGVVVTDILAIDGAAPVSCPSSTVLKNGGTLVCTYAKATASGATQLNTATAALAGNNYQGTASVNFATATVTKVDDCITVTDSISGAIGSACATDTLPKTFSYIITYGPFGADCGDHTFPNTATFTTNTTSTTGNDTWTLTISVPCPTGCTLTQGYWKTHSIYGPAKKFDPTWTAASGSVWDTGFNQDSTFYLSGQTYIQVMQTSPKGGNAYYILAHQYIAALLNIRAGAATTPAVVAALNYAQTFFLTYTPTSNLSKTTRQDAIAAAGTLGSYNEGLIGPGHCSEDTSSAGADHD